MLSKVVNEIEEHNRAIASPSTLMVKAVKKTGRNADPSVYRVIVDSVLSVLHRFGRSYRSEASSLSLDHGVSMPSAALSLAIKFATTD
ncbi:MAG TPA: hypothetical protein VGI46_22270 [Candidatus Acidoferrum sp.]|jgi:hypothetical protein